LAIDHRAGELRDAALPHPGEVRPFDEVAEGGVADGGEDPEEVALAVEAFPHVVLLQAGDVRDRWELAGLRRQAEGPAKRCRVAVDGRARLARLLPIADDVADSRCRDVDGADALTEGGE